MTTGGRGIPRLQELSYLEVAAQAVASGASFEEIRRELVDHMLRISQASPGTGNTAAYRNAKENSKRYVNNVSEALKELMRLGLVHQATLPSSASSADAHRATTFALSAPGQAWVNLLTDDRPRGYDALCETLLRYHPQFGSFLDTVGAFGGTERPGFEIPLMRWGDLRKPRDRDRYIDALALHISQELSTHSAGWSASAAEVRSAVASYVRAMIDRARARERPDPLPRNQDFVNKCEEAAVKLAFTKAGAPLDYISMEILRRWTRTLGIANFSYHAPGSYALRLWPTAELSRSENGLEIRRRVGELWRDRILAELQRAYERVRKVDRSGSPWVPIYRVRAAVCAELRVSDGEFDIALLEFLRNERGAGVPYGVNLDQSSYGNTPPSERPLIVSTPSATRIFKSMTLVPRPSGIANEGGHQ